MTMTPQEHYAEAERLLAEFARQQARRPGRYVMTPVTLTLAQIHATLATAYTPPG